jgi:hypothetical protein
VTRACEADMAQQEEPIVRVEMKIEKVEREIADIVEELGRIDSSISPELIS